MRKINVAELLKDCPKGMELDCVLSDKVELECVDMNCQYPIRILIGGKCIEDLTAEGYLSHIAFGTKGAKCVIFPKGKTTWEGFVPPCKFKDGDIITDSLGTCIFKGEGEFEGTVNYYCGISNDYFCVKDDKCNPSGHYGYIVNYRLSTEEEKERLFRAIKDNGYQWNTETKTLEKLPKFKVGDKIRNVIVNLGIHTVLNVDTSGYAVKKDDQYGNFRVNFDGEKNWELVPDVKPFDKVGDRIKSVMSSSNKFDIKTLKPFDKVLMRSSNAREWVATFYSHYSNNKFYGCGMCCSQCIPYEGNEHLLGTTDDCDTFCKTSE